IQSMALSPDGKYLAYSDANGVHVRSMQTADSRVLPDSKGMFVMYWAADSTQFFVNKGLFFGQQSTLLQRVPARRSSARTWECHPLSWRTVLNGSVDQPSARRSQARNGR